MKAMKRHFVYLYALLCGTLHVFAQNPPIGEFGQIEIFVDRVINIGPRSATFVGRIEHISGGNPKVNTGEFFLRSSDSSRLLNAFGFDSEVAMRLRAPHDGWSELVFETNAQELDPDTEYTVRLNVFDIAPLIPEGNQFVSDPFTFKTLPEGWKPTNEWQEGLLKEPEVPTYSSLPELRPKTRNVVVVTHGWLPSDPEANTKWVDEMVAAINARFIENGVSEWQAVPYKWLERANIFDPEAALSNGKSEGVNLGKDLISKKLDHIHLISYSAGSGLIQSACTILKDESEGSPETTVHLTFLDPFFGTNEHEIDSYGRNADWSDNYFAREPSLISGPFTKRLFPNIYNVDVTALDSNKMVQRFTNYTIGGVPGEVHECVTTVSSHRWPVDFYHQTITSSVLQETADGFGFGLSLEGGDWETALSLGRGNKPARVLGEPDPPCDPPSSSSTPAVLIPVLTNPKNMHIPSDTGLIEHLEKGLRMTTGSPAWVATTLSVTNSVDRMSFEAAFTDISSDGLLSVYWDNEWLGVIDQQASLPGNNEYEFPLPERATEGVLSFRLDPLSESTAQVQVDNPVLHEVPAPHFFEVELAGLDQDGHPILHITGVAGSVYTIATSENLIDWQVIAVIETIEEAITFTDTQSEQSDVRFYRASPL